MWNRYGHVAIYDDTAVKNRYRMPIGVLAVIDSEFRTRIVGQSITADTMTGTFVWTLECALASRGGKQPAIFIQDADAAMTGAVRRVLPDAQARRCLWHLYQNIIKALAKEPGTSSSCDNRVLIGASDPHAAIGTYFTVSVPCLRKVLFWLPHPILALCGGVCDGMLTVVPDRTASSLFTDRPLWTTSGWLASNSRC